jgi:hypothetical protein
MTVFYQGRCACITHKVFETYYPSYQSFAISELAQVGVAQTPAGSDPGVLVQLKVGSSGLAVAAAIVAIMGKSVFDSPPTSFGALAVLAVSALVSGACWRRRGHQHELWAVHRGQWVCLFHTPDIQVFGQVSRALCRAIEQCGNV